MAGTGKSPGTKRMCWCEIEVQHGFNGGNVFRVAICHEFPPLGAIAPGGSGVSRDVGEGAESSRGASWIGDRHPSGRTAGGSHRAAAAIAEKGRRPITQVSDSLAIGDVRVVKSSANGKIT